MPSTLSIDTFETDFINIKNNPFTNKVTILSSKIIENATISIVDITGKLVHNSKQTINNETQIALEIASGIYILFIEARDNYIFKTKIVKQ